MNTNSLYSSNGFVSVRVSYIKRKDAEIERIRSELLCETLCTSRFCFSSLSFSIGW